MYLIIDIGNTRQKAAVFDKTENLICLEQNDYLSEEILLSLCEKHAFKACIISSVGEPDQRLMNLLSSKFTTLCFSQDLKFPITLKYGTAKTLGTDRIACAVGAAKLFPKQNVLTFQAGTCLVADFVNDNEEYLGGSIAPGLNLRFRALHEGTHRLPLIAPENIDFLIGDTTQNSILSGVINGMAAEIEGLSARYSELYPDLKVVLTGGDSSILLNSLKNRIFAAQNLVLYGLFEILNFNVPEN